MDRLFLTLVACMGLLLSFGYAAQKITEFNEANRAVENVSYKDWQRRDLTKFVRLLDREYKAKGHYR